MHTANSVLPGSAVTRGVYKALRAGGRDIWGRPCRPFTGDLENTTAVPCMDISFNNKPMT